MEVSEAKIFLGKYEAKLEFPERLEGLNQNVCHGGI